MECKAYRDTLHAFGIILLSHMCFSFEQNSPNQCSLCGSTSSLTGEHKLKASLLKNEFKNQSMHFHRIDGLKIAQSSKSKAFHFKSKICKQCNSTSTQRADKAFDKFHLHMKQRFETGLELTDEFHQPIYSVSSEAEIDLFRYFAKILCCYLAEVDGPRIPTISLFAIDQIDFNRICLNIAIDEKYQKNLNESEDDGFAWHGGLQFTFNDEKTHVKTIRSSIAISGIIYNFYIKLERFEAVELQNCYPEIVQTALMNFSQSPWSIYDSYSP